MTDADVKALRRSLDRVLAELRFARETVRREGEALARAEARQKDAAEARELLQAVAAAVQQRVHDRLAGFVNDCLRQVFPDPDEFRVLFRPRRGRTEARLAWFRGGQEVEDVGDGQLDVAAFALRLVSVLTRRPRRRLLLVLDEPFRGVQRSLRPRVRDLLEALADDLKVQIILVTHDPELACGKVVEIKGGNDPAP